MRHRIGFMQGRLSPMINGKIQAFPWQHWRSEFAAAERVKVSLMEWTLDQEGLHENPLMTPQGQAEIIQLTQKHHVGIPSLTGDCFMQAPFFKPDQDQKNLLLDFEKIVGACGKLGVEMIVFPLVDNSSLKTMEEENLLIDELLKRSDLLKVNKVKIVFESDFAPARLREFIERLPQNLFGINYDIGNSASLGFKPHEEFSEYGHRIINVHVKDRVLGGTTVPLGTGSADFETVFDELKKMNYSGNFILQTARSQDGKHEEFVQKFTDFVLERVSSWN